MHVQASQGGPGTLLAALSAAVLLALAPGAVAAAAHSDGDGLRPSNGHAFGREEAPPAHAHSPAPEERPPAHASAPHAAEPDPEPDPQPDSAAGTDDTDGTGLDPDAVSEDAVRPDPDRSQSSAGSPILVAPPPPDVVLAGPPFGTSPGPPFAGPTAPPRGSDAEDGGATTGDGSEAARGHLAAPDPHGVPDVFLAPQLTRRVAVPVGLLIAGLLYLLAQGRIDRGGRLLLAPEVDGTEDDDDVYEL